MMRRRGSRLFVASAAVALASLSVMGGATASAARPHAAAPARSIAGTYDAEFSGVWAPSSLVVTVGADTPKAGTFELVALGDFGNWVLDGHTIALLVSSSNSGHAGTIFIGHVSKTGFTGKFAVAGVGAVAWSATIAGAATAIAPHLAEPAAARPFAGTYTAQFVGLPLDDTLTLTPDTVSAAEGTIAFVGLADTGSWVQMGKNVAIGVATGQDAGVTMLGTRALSGISTPARPGVYVEPGHGMFQWYATRAVAGPRLADAVSVNADGVTVERSTGTTFGPTEQWASSFTFGERGTFFADVVGDGNADVVAVDSDGILVRRSSNTGFGAIEVWGATPFYGKKGNYVADVDGDGRADVIAVSATGISVERSNGVAFGPSEAWTADPFFGTGGTFVADVDGDGKADVVAVHSSGIKVRLSTGTAFGPTQVWTGPFAGTLGTFVADVDGDGKADVIAVNADGITVERSSGTSFGAPETWTADPFSGTLSTSFADVNGDGKADAIAVNDAGITVRLSDGNSFRPAALWTTGPFSGSFGTFFADVG